MKKRVRRSLSGLLSVILMLGVLLARRFRLPALLTATWTAKRELRQTTHYRFCSTR